MKTVPLYGKKAAGRVALVDDEDYELVMQYRWNVLEAIRGDRGHGPYAVTNIGGRKNRQVLLMHKLLTGYPMTDHIDHDGLNNQRSNLRPATPLLNQRNKRGNLVGTSQFKGVCWASGEGKWLAQICIHGRRRFLGLFSSEEDAARAYDSAAREAFGEYACLNFPVEVDSSGLRSTKPG